MRTKADPTSTMRMRAESLRQALIDFHTAKHEHNLSCEEFEEELGEAAIGLREWLTKVKQAMNGSGSFKTVVYETRKRGRKK